MRAAWTFCVAVMACARAPETPPPPSCAAPAELLASTNPLDRALAPAFASACLSLRAENEALLCRRIHADLVGRYPSAAERANCASFSADQLLRELQGDPRYLLQSERYWREALSLDPTIDWRLLRALWARVDALHRGALRYDRFVVETMADPAWAVSGAVSARAFTAFLGRAPTAFEGADFERLYAGWTKTYRQGGPDNLPLSEFGASLDPWACRAIGGCRTILFGGAALALNAEPKDTHGFPTVIAWEALDPEDKRALEAPGELLSAQPELWEAEADRILDRFLAWDEGAFFPTNPGVILPPLRAALADFLRDSGDVPAAERLLLRAAVYRQQASGDPLEARPLFAAGPMKQAPAETLLDSLLGAAGANLEPCDPRYPLRHYQAELDQQFHLGTLDVAGLSRASQAIVDLLSPHARLRARPDGATVLDLRYEDLADHLGGCRTSLPDPGVGFALGHESLIEALCAAELSGLGRELRPLVQRFLGRDPSTEEAAAVEAALSTCGETCAVELCHAVAGSGELVFY
ncbi:MAG: hypothetical protein U1E65_16615 [Myxococcota bacterium]